MPIIKTISVSRSSKVNLGDYESRDAFASVGIDLEPGDCVHEVYDAAWSLVQRQVQHQENIIREGDHPMPIKNLQSKRRARFPVLGNIRKGSPKGTSKTSGWQGGDELDYWRVEFDDEEMQAEFESLYGEEPRSIRCMFLNAGVDEVFHAWNESYNKRGELTHRCDGEIMVFPREQRGQPCTGGCSAYGRLYVWLYELGRVGLMRVRTTSKHDIVHITDQLVGIKSVAGQLTGIPLVIRREQREITMQDGRRRARWMISVEIDAEKWSGSFVDAVADADIDTETGEVIKEPSRQTAPSADPERQSHVGLRQFANMPGSPATTNQRGFVAGLLTDLVGEGARVELLAALTGHTSTSELSMAQASALIEWAQTENAKEEAAACLREYAEESGQADMFDDANPPSELDAAFPAALGGWSQDQVDNLIERMRGETLLCPTGTEDEARGLLMRYGKNLDPGMVQAALAKLRKYVQNWADLEAAKDEAEPQGLL
jgi:hypothetical protein